MTKPINPYVVLALAIVLPGAGHVAARDATRGLAFACFVVLFSMISYMTTTSDQSFMGRHAGGLFVWALSIPDAYRRARILRAKAWAAGRLAGTGFVGPKGGDQTGCKTTLLIPNR